MLRFSRVFQKVFWHVYVLPLAISYDLGHRTSLWRHVVEGVGEQRKQKPSAVAYVIIVSF
jgi:hypothetical protein